MNRHDEVMTERALLLVGVDGSATGHKAIDWAARAALRHNATLHLLHSYSIPVDLAYGTAVVPVLDPEIFSEGARGLLAEEAAIAANLAPDVAVDTTAVLGHPGQNLSDASKSAAMLVVGRSGRSALAHFFLGSVARYVVHHATSPVVVVPEGADIGPITKMSVAIDGSECSEHALAWAADEADLCGASLSIVHAWPVPATDYVTLTDQDRYGLKKGAQLLVEASERRVKSSHPNLRTATAVVEGYARRELLDAMTDTDLIVCGTHGRNAAARVLVGSTAQYIAEHAHCPVAVVR